MPAKVGLRSPLAVAVCMAVMVCVVADTHGTVQTKRLDHAVSELGDKATDSQDMPLLEEVEYHLDDVRPATESDKGKGSPTDYPDHKSISTRKRRNRQRVVAKSVGSRRDLMSSPMRPAPTNAASRATTHTKAELLPLMAGGLAKKALGMGKKVAGAAMPAAMGAMGGMLGMGGGMMGQQPPHKTCTRCHFGNERQFRRHMRNHVFLGMQITHAKEDVDNFKDKIRRAEAQLMMLHDAMGMQKIEMRERQRLMQEEDQKQQMMQASQPKSPAQEMMKMMMMKNMMASMNEPQQRQQQNAMPGLMPGLGAIGHMGAMGTNPLSPLGPMDPLGPLSPLGPMGAPGATPGAPPPGGLCPRAVAALRAQQCGGAAGAHGAGEGGAGGAAAGAGGEAGAASAEGGEGEAEGGAGAGGEGAAPGGGAAPAAAGKKLARRR